MELTAIIFGPCRLLLVRSGCMLAWVGSGRRCQEMEYIKAAMILLVLELKISAVRTSNLLYEYIHHEVSHLCCRCFGGLGEPSIRSLYVQITIPPNTY